MKTKTNILFAIGLYALTSFPPLGGQRGACQVGIGIAVPTGMLHIDPISAAAIIIDPYNTGAGQTGELRLLELAANGTNYVGFKAPDNLSSNLVFTLPATDGTSGQALVTNGSGILSWATPGTSTGWWEELGSATIGSPADQISVNITSKKYLHVLVHIAATGGAADGGIIFNNDGANNYADRQSSNGAADVTNINLGALSAVNGATTDDKFFSFFVVNELSYEKLVICENIQNSGAGAGNAPIRREMVGKWANTAAQINRVDIQNFGAGDFAIGSTVSVFGHD